MGHQKIFLVFATVIVLDENGRILVQHRSDFSFSGLPGGVMELNEDIQTTARREVLEETGFSIGNLALIGVYTDPKYDVLYPNGDQVQQFTVCFSAFINGGKSLPDGDEIVAHQFVAKDDVLTYDWPIWYRQMLTDFLFKKEPAFQPFYSHSERVDQVKTLRKHVGTQRVILVGGTAIIRNDQDEILMFQRSDNLAWVFPAGYSDIGENVAQTVVREVKEESQLDVAPKRIIGVYSDPYFNHTYPNGDQVQNVSVLFDCELLSQTINLDLSEVVDFKWVIPNQLPDKIAPVLRLFGEKVAQHIDQGTFVF